MTEPGRTVVKYGVTIHGPLNLPSTMGQQSSQLYSKNISTFLLALVKDGNLNLDMKDDLVRGPLVTSKGEILHQGTKVALEKLATVKV